MPVRTASGGGACHNEYGASFPRRSARRDAGRLPPWLPGIAFSPPGSGSARTWQTRRVPDTPQHVPAEPDPAPEDVPATCSARGCRAAATWVLVWNNPRVHTPDRRKTWVACDAHRGSLSEFLGLRGFLKDVVALGDWAPGPR